MSYLWTYLLAPMCFSTPTPRVAWQPSDPTALPNAIAARNQASSDAALAASQGGRASTDVGGSQMAQDQQQNLLKKRAAAADMGVK